MKLYLGIQVQTLATVLFLATFNPQVAWAKDPPRSKVIKDGSGRVVGVMQGNRLTGNYVIKDSTGRRTGTIERKRGFNDTWVRKDTTGREVEIYKGLKARNTRDR